MKFPPFLERHPARWVLLLTIWLKVAFCWNNSTYLVTQFYDQTTTEKRKSDVFVIGHNCRVFLKRRPKTPWTKTKTRWTRTKTPWTETKTPWTKTKTPWTKTKTSWTKTKTPWTKMKPPWTKMKTPWTQTKTPWTNTKTPWTKTKTAWTKTKTQARQWRELDREERAMLAKDDAYQCKFWKYLELNYKMMKDNIVAKVRRQARLKDGPDGKPIRSYTNSSEFMNHVDKRTNELAMVVYNFWI